MLPRAMVSASSCSPHRDISSSESLNSITPLTEPRNRSWVASGSAKQTDWELRSAWMRETCTVRMFPAASESPRTTRRRFAMKRVVRTTMKLRAMLVSSCHEVKIWTGLY
ncbi:hypothetical protein C8Q76DRAFT_747757 [Earliella scabrosa]|nr:hypothetical protein C8Q76DRAFT_747757 [Earliella scabrosa]